MPEYVSLKQLAEELAVERSNMRKYVLKHGFSTVNVRTPDSRSQLTLALTAEDAEAVRELRQSQGFGTESKPVENGKGYWYVIQLIPEYAPNRVKLGFAIDVMARLAAHKTSAPTAKLVRSWPCKRSWEPVAIESATRTGCTHIANEVYECDSLDALIDRCESFFAIMPEVS